MPLAKIKPMIEGKAFKLRESESYRIPEVVWREHLGQGGYLKIWYEVEMGGVVKKKMFKVFVKDMVQGCHCYDIIVFFLTIFLLA